VPHAKLAAWRASDVCSTPTLGTLIDISRKVPFQPLAEIFDQLEPLTDNLHFGIEATVSFEICSVARPPAFEIGVLAFFQSKFFVNVLERL